jgi:DNA polymerase III alpha subunit (gram-positive type)
VRPSKKITDYVSDISGVTFTHIKNAPNEETVLQEVKKLLYNKTVVGHTVNKDL